MKILLDTHVLLWWLADSPRLRKTSREKLSNRNNEVFVSVVSLLEIAIKIRIGKLDADIAVIAGNIENEGFLHLPIAQDHLLVFTNLPIFHRDPFDHMLIAQTISEGASLFSVDAAFAPYPVDLMRH